MSDKNKSIAMKWILAANSFIGCTQVAEKISSSEELVNLRQCRATVQHTIKLLMASHSITEADLSEEDNSYKRCLD